MELNLYKSPSQKFSKSLVQIKYAQLIYNDLERMDNVQKLELKKKFLVNSYYINLIALWQTFIEELLSDSVTHLISKSSMEIGKILEINLDNRLKRMSNPNAENIEDNIKFLIGYEKVLNDLPNDLNAKIEINKILKIRHSIAHTSFSDTYIDIESNFETMHYLLNIAEKLEEIIFKRIDKN